MPRDEQHDHEACTRAWQMLRKAHDLVARRLTADLARARELAINDVDILLHLRAHTAETVRINNLRDAVPLSHPALSRLVSRLAERGLVVRSEAVDDGRAAVIGLTEAGGALHDRAMEVHARAVHEALTSKCSDEEQTALLKTLSRIGRCRNLPNTKEHDHDRRIHHPGPAAFADSA